MYEILVNLNYVMKNNSYIKNTLKSLIIRIRRKHNILYLNGIRAQKFHRVCIKKQKKTLLQDVYRQ